MPRNSVHYSQRDAGDSYFADRSATPYRSTVHLHDFLSAKGFFEQDASGSTVLDLGCGTGSETAWLARNHPECRFIGVDLEQRFVDEAHKRHGELSNVAFAVGDAYDAESMSKLGPFMSIWLSQVLSWLPWWEEPMAAICSLDAQHIGMSILGWDGPFHSKVVHLLGPPSAPDTGNFTNYNVYSIPLIADFMGERGYDVFDFKPFEIDLELPRPQKAGLGSYTRDTTDGERLTFSAWQCLPWHFLYFSKTDS
jgi:SAM-dependent methyltransferase